VLFAFIFFDPLEPILLFAILPIPGILFAAGYLLYSYQMSKRDNDNVAHDAHFLGAVIGFIFPVLLKPDLFDRFIDKCLHFCNNEPFYRSRREVLKKRGEFNPSFAEWAFVISQKFWLGFGGIPCF
jgi:hypothetical protein